MKDTLAKDLDKFVLRLPNGLRDKLKIAAEENNRSMNAEIVGRLEFSLVAHPHAYLIRALLDLSESLLAGLQDFNLPTEIRHEVIRMAKARGLGPEQFLTKLLIEALNYLDDESELGREFARRVFEQHDDER